MTRQFTPYAAILIAPAAIFAGVPLAGAVILLRRARRVVALWPGQPDRRLRGDGVIT